MQLVQCLDAWDDVFSHSCVLLCDDWCVPLRLDRQVIQKNSFIFKMIDKTEDTAKTNPEYKNIAKPLRIGLSSFKILLFSLLDC